MIQQMEAAECGVACLAMILDRLGCSVPLAEVRMVCGTSRDGNRAADLLKGARRLGLEGRGVGVTFQSLNKLRAPAILHWNSNHFVVYESSDDEHMNLVDPASGRRRIPFKKATKCLSGVAVELWRGKSFERRKAQSLSYRRYVTALLQHKKSLAFVLCASVTGQLLALFAPAAQQILVDHIILPARLHWLLPMLGVMLLAAVTSLTLSRLHGVSQALLNTALGIQLTRHMAEHLVRLPLPFLQSRNHGDLMARVQLNGSLQGLLARTAKSGIDLVFALALTLLMLAYDPYLGGLSLGLTVLRIALLRVLRRAMAERASAEIAAGAREQSALVEAASLVEMAKGFGAEDRLSERYARRAAERARWGVESARLGLAVGSAMTVIGASMHALIFWVGGSQVVSGQMSLGVLLGFLAIRGMLEIPLAALVGLVEGWLRVRGTLERCDDILCVAPASVGSVRPTRLEGHVELENVGFRYGSGGQWVLRNVNLCIQSGEHVAFAGPSGQGKSTLAQLICGLLEPSEGRVMLDGVDLRHYDREVLARHMGVVLQAPLIFEGTVLDALRLRHPQADAAAVREAARLACFDEVVERLPRGYQGAIEAMGANLSGGERQRLTVAQAVLGRPALLVLDEATCSLDAQLERRLIENLSTLSATVISVAHRDAVLARASRVFRVAGGRAEEDAKRATTSAARLAHGAQRRAVG